MRSGTLMIVRTGLGGVLCAALFLGGCGGATLPSGTKLSELRTAPPTTQTVERSVSRADFVAAVERAAGKDRLRLVPVYRRETAGAGAIPEYRVFDVGGDTPYGLIGLESADILIAINDYVIYQPEGFRAYVKLLGSEKEVGLEVLRGGKPVVIRTTFSE